MKTDADLKKEVIAELAWDPAVEATAIGVAVKDGVVTPTGHLDTFAGKHAASGALRRVAGYRRSRSRSMSSWRQTTNAAIHRSQRRGCAR